MSGNVNVRPNVLNLAERTTVSSKRTVRAPLTKKRSKGIPLCERVTLDRVLGFTVKDNRTFACDPNTGLVVYPAGCVIVLFNPRRNKQSHIVNHSRKTITSLAISGDGKNIVSGECGHKPAVRVWDVEDRTQLAEFHGHKFGINCVAFSPNLKYVISVGEQHDMVVNVWDWKTGSKHGTGKISIKVTGLAFSEDGSRFVTVGNRSVRFWYMAIKSKTRQTVPLNSRSGILGEQRNNFFCSVACGLGVNQSKTYAVTKSGLLCEFSEQRLLDKWVELRTTNAYCIIATDEYLFVGCTDGIVRLFSASSLNFVATLPRPHFLGVNVSEGIDPSHMITHSEDARFPAVMAITCDDVNKKITCIYNDHSMYVWDIRDVKKVGKQRSFLYHSSCIWGAEVYPSLSESDKEALPPGSFLTYASDDTIRIWNVDPAMNTDTFKRNIYSNELLKVIYVDDQLENLCNVSGSSSAAADKGDSVEGKSGIRCVSISSDGQLLASGDRSGNVRVHDMQFMDEVHKIEAHDSEVLCLEFSRPDSGYYLLCSASRDRLIHVFNMQEDCSLVQTIDDHSSSITAVKFTQANGRLQMISCGADKALMFRVVTQNPDFEFIRNHHVVGKTTIYDLTVDPTEKYVATACQDRNIRIHNAVTGKLKRTYKGSLADDGTLIRVEVDPSGMYIATSCSDKSVALFDFYSGECVATMVGHSELVTGIKFTNDCKHLISTSGDGCIFVWRLPWGFTHNMKERLSEIGQHMQETPQYPQLGRRGTYVVPPELMGDPSAVATETRHNNINNSRAMASVKGGANYPEQEEIIIDDQEDDDDEEEDQTDWQAKPKLESTADLPLWAKKQVCGEDIPSPTTYSNPTQPRGRWAQRLDSKGFKVKSEWDAHRDIELKMEECIDRRRYTVEPEALADQAALAEAEKIQNSLTIEEADEFVSAEEGLAGLEEQVNISNPLLKGFVTSSRGSDPFLPPTSHPSDALMSPDTPDDDQGSAKLDEEAEEEEEEEANEVIIYPPSEESITSPESLQFLVTESTSSMEELQRRRARSFIKHEQKEKESPRNSRVIQDEDLVKAEGSESTDPVSLGTSEDEEEDEDEEEEEEEEEEEVEEESKPSMEDDPSSSTSPSTSGNNTESATTSQDSPSPDQDKDEESFLHTNFTFAEKEKFGKCLEQLQSGFASVGISNGMQHRLSISSKFLSRSQSSHLKSIASNMHKMPTSSVGGVTAQVMGWKSLSLSSKSTTSSSSSSSTTTTTPILTPTSPKKSLHTSNNQEHSKEGEMPVNIEQVEVVKEPAKSTDLVDHELNERDAPLDYINKEQDSEKLVETVEAKTESQQTLLENSDVNEKEAVKEDLTVTEESRQVVEKESNETLETKESQTTNEDIPSCDQTDTRLSALTDDSGQASLDVMEVSTSDLNVLTDVSISRPSSRSESIISSDSQSSVITTTSEHLPIIKGKRSSTKDTTEAVEKANKENLERTSKYESHQSRRSISSGSRSKVERMKARKEQTSATTMRKATSMSDLREASKDEEGRTESPTFNIVLKTHPRSQSVERKRIRANSPAREKYRARTERVLPNVPNLLKPKSYEIGTTSSRAKKSTRKENDTPPSSPSRLKKKKRPSLGGAVEGSKPSKSEETSPETESVTARFTRAGDTQLAKDSLVEKTQQQSESAIELTDKTSNDQLINEAVSQIDSTQIPDGLALSTSPQLTSDASSQQDIEPNSKDSGDALAMPPPTSTTVCKSSRIGRRSSASKAVEELRQRKRSSSNTPPPTNETATSGDQRTSSDSVSASDHSQVDSTRSSRRKVAAAAYREKRSNSLNLTRRSSPPRSSSPCPTSPRPLSPRPLSPRPASPRTARKGSAPNIKVEFKQNGESPKKDLVRPVPRRRRREKSESSETNASNNNNTTNHSDDGNTHSPRTRTDRRRSSLNSETVERRSSPRIDHVDREVLKAAGTTSESMDQDACEATEIRVPSPEGGSPTLTFDMLKAKVDTMKTAFDQCLDLCYQIRSAEGENHQHFFNYFNSTLSQMQSASSTISSTRQQRHLLNPSVTTDDTMSDVSETSLPFDEVPQSFSSGIPTNRQSMVSPTDINALKSSLASCQKTRANGMTVEGETTSAVALLDHYSDLLVSLVRQKIGDEVSEGTTTTETQQTLEPAL